MHSTIQAIIFDFGGVLLDWDPWYLYQHHFSDRQAMESFLAEVNFFDWNAQQDKGRAFATGIAELTAQFPSHTNLIQTYYDRWEDSISGSIPGTVEILYKLKQQGYPLYGLSNWSSETFPRATQKYPFFQLFDDIILSGDVKLLKPDPAIFNLLLSKTGLSAHECLLIDDSQPNIDAAKELGFATIHFISSEHLRTELQMLNLL
jgi:2-haloacid dehalogenase